MRHPGHHHQPFHPRGYAPLVDNSVAHHRFDGDDGVSFLSASALESIWSATPLPSRGWHRLAPPWRDVALVIRASDYGYRAGDQLVVLSSLRTSAKTSPPSAGHRLHMGNLADVNKDHLVSLRSGFQ